jgi:hypothetical protein
MVMQGKNKPRVRNNSSISVSTAVQNTSLYRYGTVVETSDDVSGFAVQYFLYPSFVFRIERVETRIRYDRTVFF